MDNEIFTVLHDMNNSMSDMNDVIRDMNDVMRKQSILISKLYYILDGHGCFDDLDRDFIGDKVTKEEYLKKIKEN